MPSTVADEYGLGALDGHHVLCPEKKPRLEGREVSKAGRQRDQGRTVGTVEEGGQTRSMSAAWPTGAK